MTNTTEIPYNITDRDVTVFVEGEALTATRTPSLVRDLLAAIEGGDVAEVQRLMSPATRYAEALSDSGVDVDLLRGTVTVNGKRVARHLESRILEVVDAGADVTRWKRFVANLHANPSMVARQELSLFLESDNLPITADGCFLAYKRVRADYKDCHSGTIDNSVGQEVSMPRQDVDDDRRKTCSVGLHFCSLGYLKSFWGDRLMVVKVNPADVVSIPEDYGNTKGRTWRYVVVDEITDTQDMGDGKTLGDRLRAAAYVPDDDDEYDEWDEDGWADGFDDEDTFLDDDFDPEEAELDGQDVTAVRSETAFVAPEAPREQSVWGRVRAWVKGD